MALLPDDVWLVILGRCGPGTAVRLVCAVPRLARALWRDLASSGVSALEAKVRSKAEVVCEWEFGQTRLRLTCDPEEELYCRGEAVLFELDEGWGGCVLEGQLCVRGPVARAYLEALGAAKEEPLVAGARYSVHLETSPLGEPELVGAFESLEGAWVSAWQEALGTARRSLRQISRRSGACVLPVRVGVAGGYGPLYAIFGRPSALAVGASAWAAVNGNCRYTVRREA
jgi:hypothetical protein